MLHQQPIKYHNHTMSNNQQRTPFNKTITLEIKESQNTPLENPINYINPKCKIKSTNTYA